MDLTKYINDARQGLMQLPQVDESKMRMERLQRLQHQLAENDLGEFCFMIPLTSDTPLTAETCRSGPCTMLPDIALSRPMAKRLCSIS